MNRGIEIAAQFLRDALEELRGPSYSDEVGLFHEFPDGCCDYASAYLGRYLIREQICLPTEIEAPAANTTENHQGYGHTWLRIGKTLHVDITADQFSNANKPVIVISESQFHSEFEGVQWEPFEILEDLVFERMSVKLPYLRTVWDALAPNLPKISDEQAQALNP